LAKNCVEKITPGGKKIMRSVRLMRNGTNEGELSEITDDEGLLRQDALHHINDNRNDVMPLDSESDSDSSAGFRRQSRHFLRTEWKGEKKPDDTKYENWFLFDNNSWHLGFHMRRYKRRTLRAASKFKKFVVNLPWHHIRVAIISLLFVASMGLFMSVHSPDEDPVTHIAGVSSLHPIYRDLHDDEPLDTIRVNLAIQETRNASEWTYWPDNTTVTVYIQGISNNATDNTWSNLGIWSVVGNTEESVAENNNFFLSDSDKNDFHTYRVMVTSNTESALGLRLDILQLTWLARYEVVIGFGLLFMVYALIIFEWVHRTVAALIGSFWSLAVLSFVVERPTFLEVIEWIDYDTIGLLFGMMVLVGIFSTTGFFEWSAVQAYKLSRGNIWRLVIMLCGFTAVASMFLDNVTTILLVAPVTLRLCRVLDLDPLPVLLCEVIFSNIGGTATGIGDPPNILIISNSQIKQSGIVDFSTFTLHVAPGALIAMVTTFIMINFVYKKRICQRAPVDPLTKEITIWKKTLHSYDTNQKGLAQKGHDSVREKLVQHIRELEERQRQKMSSVAALEAALEAGEHSEGGSEAQKGKGKEKAENDAPGPDTSESGDQGDQGAPTINLAEMEKKYRITDITLFIKSYCVLAVVIILFFLHSFLHEINMPLPWIAILGSMVLLLLSGEDNFHEILEKVETCTLLFFAGLFVMVRCVEELGVTIWIAKTTADFIEVFPEGKIRLALAVILIIWVCAIVSMFIDNIPFTTTMIPVVVKLSQGALNLPLGPLTWAMAFGACLGGNGTLIGASANVVAAGIAEQFGQPISFNYFFKMGFPCMVVSTVTATIYMVLTHVLIEWY